MKKSNASSNTQELPYEGFCIDLLNKLHEKLQFVYDVQLKDKFGEKQAEGTWDGIIGQLSRGVCQNLFGILSEKTLVGITSCCFSLFRKTLITGCKESRKGILFVEVRDMSYFPRYCYWCCC